MDAHPHSVSGPVSTFCVCVIYIMCVCNYCVCMCVSVCQTSRMHQFLDYDTLEAATGGGGIGGGG